jgi:hypothetical protein
MGNPLVKATTKPLVNSLTRSPLKGRKGKILISEFHKITVYESAPTLATSRPKLHQTSICTRAMSAAMRYPKLTARGRRPPLDCST